MKKNKISKNWVNKQRRDTYVRQSKVDGYRARSAYKLKEIDEKFRIFKGGMSVIDIGAAPISITVKPPLKILNLSSISINLYTDLALYPSILDLRTYISLLCLFTQFFEILFFFN